jgi:integrase
MPSIIKACKSDIDKALILPLIDSTCRIGELVGLTADNIGSAGLTITGKTGQRHYRCDPIICEQLRKLGEGQKSVFMGVDGNPASVDSLKHRAHRIIIDAGITGAKLGPIL